MSNAFAEPAHPPLSLRDISPTRGEIVLSLGSTPSVNTIFTAADEMFVRSKRAPRATNLPPCGGDVARATEGGAALSAPREVSAQ